MESSERDLQGVTGFTQGVTGPLQMGIIACLNTGQVMKGDEGCTMLVHEL